MISTKRWSAQKGAQRGNEVIDMKTQLCVLSSRTELTGERAGT